MTAILFHEGVKGETALRALQASNLKHWSNDACLSTFFVYHLQLAAASEH